MTLGGHVLGFARLLRRAGLPVGSGQMLDAVSAVASVDVTQKDDVYWALAATLVRRHEELGLFREAFELWFRDPLRPNPIMEELLAKSRIPPRARPSGSRRVYDAMRAAPPAAPVEQDRVDVDVTMTASTEAALRTRDFEKMSAAEVAAAKEVIRRLELGRAEVVTRRFAPDPRATRLDVRRTLQASMRSGGQIFRLRRKEHTTRPPPIVALCDVSGSMERYSRMVLHFLHALTGARDRVSSFTFATSLTNITRSLAARDVDEALARVGKQVKDWSGGTRIGACLHTFNRKWARRVLGQGAIVLLMTDGLEREPPELLAREAEWLRRSSRRLIWLNPLLRFAGFEPRAAGVAALLPHVDEHRPVHDLRSLEQLAQALSGAR